ncbi:DNA polymerase III subunit delta' [Candidatus Methylocalor cossyra]|uniref:DNA polymerase III subunit delta' n=1 Tax=Candidatus Methylocalor cossyra TaxID=3108543 RepID=A0ABM9NGA0_9GAMM
METDALYPWLAESWGTLDAFLTADRLPQALLIRGAVGVGKTELAERFAQKLLCRRPGRFACGTCGGCRLFVAGNHPDFIPIRPTEPGRAIGVDSIRQLIADLALKPQYGDRRVVVIDPAQQLNGHAANALLKTLEEPAEGTVLVLLADTSAALAPTVVSRCQRLSIPTPDRSLVGRWLEQRHPGCTGAALLAAAQGSPLRAAALAASDVVERRRTAFAEWRGVVLGQKEPVAVAERWEAQPHEELLEWLLSWTADAIRLGSAPGCRPRYNPDLGDGLQVLAGRLDLQRLFEFWTLLLQARLALGGQANRQLLWEEILIRGAQLSSSLTPSRGPP